MVPTTLAQFDATKAMREASRRYAVIDVGSNSIRLVIFDRLSRGLSVMFNEKILCGLGSDLALTSRLTQKGIHQALDSLTRFNELIKAMEVEVLGIQQQIKK